MQGQSLPWNTRSYIFQVDNGEEFGSSGDIWDALDTQLRAAGITWIRVNSVENPADGTFEVWFDLDENKDNMSRSIHMGYSYSAYFIITQLKQDQEHFEELYADLPANRKFEVLPGEEISIQLHGLSAGTSYDIYRYYSDEDTDIFDTFLSNTGGDYLYTSAFPEGDFGFSFPTVNSVSVTPKLIEIITPSIPERWYFLRRAMSCGSISTPIPNGTV